MSPPEFLCKCGKTFRQKSGLSRHKKTACDMEERAEPRFKCSVCDQQFIRKDNWAHHEEGHRLPSPKIQYKVDTSPVSTPAKRQRRDSGSSGSSGSSSSSSTECRDERTTVPLGSGGPLRVTQEPLSRKMQELGSSPLCRIAGTGPSETLVPKEEPEAEPVAMEASGSTAPAENAQTPASSKKPEGPTLALRHWLRGNKPETEGQQQDNVVISHTHRRITTGYPSGRTAVETTSTTRYQDGRVILSEEVEVKNVKDPEEACKFCKKEE